MDHPYKVRDESWARLKKAILALHLKKNNSSNYNHTDAQFFIKKVGYELEHDHNKFSNDGMKGLTSNDYTNKLIMICSKVAITWQAVISASKKKATAEKYRQEMLTTPSPRSNHQPTPTRRRTAKT